MQQSNQDFDSATGEIKYTLAGDVMIHYVMQNSKKTLINFISALKGISPKDVKDILIMNPMDFNNFDDKKSIMDFKLLLNNGEIINIELQMYMDNYWINRSLLYLCKGYNSIEDGQPYSLLKPMTQICITDQDLFPSTPEFYSHYLMLNVKNHQPYSNNLAINVLQLKHLNLATEEDKKNQLDYWARLFLAKTWEDLKCLVKEKPSFKEVARMVYQANADEKMKYILEAEYKYQSVMATQYESGRIDAEQKFKPIIAEKDSTIAEKDALLKKYKEKYGDL